MKRLTLCCLIFIFASSVGCKKKNAATNKKKAAQTAKVKKRIPAKKADTSLPGDPVAGETVYKSTCSACHGANGKGNGGMTGADFIGEPERLKKDNKVLLNSIRNGVAKPGKPAMPAHKKLLTDKQIKDALSYIRKTFGGTKK